MKNINIISEAIYKGKHKLVNQGAFINFSDLINDIFYCDGLTCACTGDSLNKSDIFIRKAYLRNSRKKPGANWTSLEQIVKDVYNCCSGENLCANKGHDQWWITTDIIRPRKTIETINFTNLIIKTLTCCELLSCCAPVTNPGFFYMRAIWPSVGVTDQASFETFLTSIGYVNPVITDFSLIGDILTCTLFADVNYVVNYSSLRIYEIQGLGSITPLMGYALYFRDYMLPSVSSRVEIFNITTPGQLNNVDQIYLANNLVSTFKIQNYVPKLGSQINLSYNQMTSISYADTLTSVNNWSAGTATWMYLNNNIDSVSGTDLETALISKGYTVIS